MVEKRLIAIPPQLFLANGGANGVITVADACIFKVKQAVIIDAIGVGPTTDLEVKRVPDDTHLIIGPKHGNIDARANLSAYTVALGANIFANEQFRPKIPFEEFTRATYEEEPTVAQRVVMVDRCGDKYGPNNPLPIAFDGTIAVGNVTIQDDDGDELEVNPDGSINVNIVGQNASDGKSFYNEISSVPSVTPTLLLTYTVPPLTTTELQILEVSGTNIATYTVQVNAVTTDKKRTYFGGNLNENFNFDRTITLVAGDVLTVTVEHGRTFLGDFNARLGVFESL